MKPSLLQRQTNHRQTIQTNHPEKKYRNPNYFTRLGESAKKRLDNTGKQYQQLVGMVIASYEVALIVAKNRKPHSIREELIMYLAKVLVKHVIGDEAALKLNSVSLLSNAIQRHITEMSFDINKHVLTEVQSSKYGFAKQPDETTDVSNCAQLLVFVRYAILKILFEVNYC